MYETGTYFDMVILDEERKGRAIGLHMFREVLVVTLFYCLVAAGTNTNFLETLHWNPSNALDVGYREVGQNLSGNRSVMFLLGVLENLLSFLETFFAEGLFLLFETIFLFLFKAFGHGSRRFADENDAMRVNVIPSVVVVCKQKKQERRIQPYFFRRFTQSSLVHFRRTS